jgi:hypothetical protein
MAVVEKVFDMAWGRIKATFKLALKIIEGLLRFSIDWIKGSWKGLWSAVENTAKLAWDGIRLMLKIAWDLIVGVFDVMINLFTGHWKTAWTDIKTTAKSVWNDILTWFGTIANDLWKVGVGLINGLKGGIIATMKDIKTWGYDDIVKPILNFLLSPTGFHISSPSKKTEPIGRQIITGIIQGMVSEGKNIGKFVGKVFGGWPNTIWNFISKGLNISKLPAKALELIFGKAGSAVASGWNKVMGFFGAHHTTPQSTIGGVTRWAGLVSKALTMLRLPQALSGAVLYQMQTESGGNPDAINLWDSNAKAGHPSQGLMQVIPSTFARWHVTGTSGNILDPLANIAAAINYAIHNRGIGGGQGQLGSGHGYDTGGWLPPGVTLAYNLTGKSERVLSHDEFNSMQAGGTQYHAHFDGLTGTAIESHVRTAFQTMSLTQGNLQRQGRRS